MIENNSIKTTKNTGEWIRNNPVTFILAIVTLMALYDVYSSNHKLRRVCDLSQSASQITAAAPLDQNGQPISDRDYKAQIAFLKQRETAHTTDGELYRWQNFEGKEIEAICDHPADRDQ